ncbi:uracil-xanthine permease family protein [Desulfotomaculum copahuensis]|uniref:Xanthine permease n=1 Tax=Desulfotomaculum copahuensis TaxID=1838280 RepID=A0A1B7LAE6_9FIRM|nr:solute carrier family 23 protein [Desulfotomaculum copahuensis]OAT79287.1 xanthine permease [Desulfotomaculum copahuensis]
MEKITFKYGLDDTPPIMECILLGLQWLAIVVPIVIIIGKVVSGLHFDNPTDQIIYIQKLFFISGASMLVQVLWGHRLPLIMGPATVLLVGVVASRGSNFNAVYSAVIIGGVILSALSVTGLFGHLKKLFTPRVIATILIMIAFTLTPMILGLITTTTGKANALPNLLFALVFVLLLFIANKRLTGIWKATLIIWSIIVGTIFYYFLFPQSVGAGGGEGFPVSAAFLTKSYVHLAIEPGILISFLICFMALSINDLGSIQSLAELIQPDHMEKRITRGISITGLFNVISGFLGIIGPVNFSLSPGVIASTGIASRFTLIPAAFGLLLLSFLPKAIGFLGSVPPVVIGTSLIYIMCSQIAAGLQTAFNSMPGFKFEYGLVMGLPMMLSIIISFLPGDVLSMFPALLRPVIGNGFVVGVLSVFFMEHIIYRERV